METLVTSPPETCSECRSELEQVELAVSQLGGPPLCDSCRDRYYYETPQGQLELIQGRHELEVEKLKDQIGQLEQGVIDAKAREVAQRRTDAARIAALESEVARLRAESIRWPGPRSRPSGLA